MNRDGGFPYFLWQEYSENWETFSFNKVAAANKAAKEDQKKVTLPSSNPEEKTTIYFETMISKNGNGVEKPLRCLILTSNSKYAIWAIDKNSDGKCISFPPRLTYFLELMYLKNASKLNFYYKAEYEVDFIKRIVTKNNVRIFNICREEMEFSPSSWSKADMQKYALNIFFSERLLKEVSTYSVDRIKILLFNILITGTEISSSSTLSLSSYDWILNLNEDVIPKDCDLMMVDPLCEINKSIECSVVCENGCFFSASLVLTDIEENINSFCILQLLKLKNKRKYLVYTRCGRVGYNGQCNSEMFLCLKEAKEHFKERFYDRTQNCWAERHSFLRKENKYDMIDTYFKTGNTVDECCNPSLENILSTLDKKLQDILLLFLGTGEADLKLVIQNWLLKSVITTNGVATAKQVVKSFVALKEVSELLANRSSKEELLQACNKYFMKMPHATNNNAPKTILCAEAIEDEVLTLQILAYAYVKECDLYSVENPVKGYFDKLQWDITYLEHGSPEFAVLQQSLSELHGTHIYQIELVDAYKWYKQAEHERFEDKGNKMLLWHGTHPSNILGIIQHGLKLPPDDAQNNTSSMFGRALYFADVSSKSANYRLVTKKNDIGLLLLCEVSMGRPLEVINVGDYSTHPIDFGGVLGIGKYHPSEFVESILVPGTLIPKGPLKRRNRNDTQLKYNTYAIYNERQVKIQYLLKIKFSTIEVVLD